MLSAHSRVTPAGYYAGSPSIPPVYPPQEPPVLPRQPAEASHTAPRTRCSIKMEKAPADCWSLFACLISAEARWLIQELAELAALGRMAQLLQRLRLDLPDALAGYLEVAAHFLQRPRVAVLQAEAHLQHVPLPLRQLRQHILDLLPQDQVRRRLRR